MKLYATTTSERASKGQGGNDYIEVELSVNREVIGHIFLDYMNDIKDEDEEDEWVLKWKHPKAVDPEIIAQGHTIPKTKGERQKGGICYCECEMSVPHYH